MRKLLEKYTVGNVQVTQQERSLESDVWECDAVLVSDTLQVVSLHLPGVEYFIKHNVWQIGSSQDIYNLLASSVAVGEEYRQELEKLIPPIMKYIAHARAANYNISFGDDPTLFIDSLDTLLGEVISETRKYPHIEFYQNNLEQIGKERFVP